MQNPLRLYNVSISYQLIRRYKQIEYIVFYRKIDLNKLLTINVYGYFGRTPRYVKLFFKIVINDKWLMKQSRLVKQFVIIITNSGECSLGTYVHSTHVAKGFDRYLSWKLCFVKISEEMKIRDWIPIGFLKITPYYLVLEER